jgi:type III pantothenate kinase
MTVPARRASLMLLDVGNSRLKWARLTTAYRSGRRFERHGVLELSALSRGTALIRLLRAAGHGAEVRVCNVAGAQAERLVRAAARAAGASSLRFERSVRSAGGVRSGYREPWRLGVDRWVALIGARHEYPELPLCIVAVGTALTIDLLDAAGQHLGGSITPGPRLMIETLLTHTAGIRRRAGGRRALEEPTHPVAPFEHDTRSGLIAGARFAGAALIERALTEARARLGRRTRLLIGGGGADAVLPLLGVRYRRADELVLRGLAVLASERIP